MCKEIAVAVCASGKGGDKLQNAIPKIHWQCQDRAQLDHNGVHLPEPVVQIDPQQRFADAQMRSGAHGKEFGQSFHDAEENGHQVIVHVLEDWSGNGSTPGTAFCAPGHSASAPRSPVRMRTASSTSDTKILPSPILPVLAAPRMASTARWARSSVITISNFTFGRKSTVYSVPR